MATNARQPTRPRIGGPQRVKVHDENETQRPSKPSGVPLPVASGPKRVPVTTKFATTGRAALGEITTRINQSKNIPAPKQTQPSKSTVNDIAKAKRGRSNSVIVSSGAQRVPIQTNRASLQVEKQQQRISIFGRIPVQLQEESQHVSSDEIETPVEQPSPSDAMDLEGFTSEEEVDTPDTIQRADEVDGTDDLEEMTWPSLSPEKEAEYNAQVEALRQNFVDEDDPMDTTMVTEYAQDILNYMGELELETLPSPNYMNIQTEITWEIREKLVDWLCQAHLRYHMVPETLWITVNLVDRFLSRRPVSLVKLQLVGASCMFIAAKFEEIMAPTVEEFVFITDNTYTKEEILKGERVILTTLDFRISHYCSPYTWVRRISKADDYDIQTRTLSKFLMEVMLLDHRFLAAKPSLMAAVAMFSSRKILGGNWDDSFVYYSGFTEEYLLPGHHLLLEKMTSKDFTQQNVCRKYAHKRFLKASLFAVDWARNSVDVLAVQGGTQTP